MHPSAKAVLRAALASHIRQYQLHEYLPNRRFIPLPIATPPFIEVNLVNLHGCQSNPSRQRNQVQYRRHTLEGPAHSTITPSVCPSGPQGGNQRPGTRGQNACTECKTGRSGVLLRWSKTKDERILSSPSHFFVMRETRLHPRPKIRTNHVQLLKDESIASTKKHVIFCGGSRIEEDASSQMTHLISPYPMQNKGRIDICQSESHPSAASPFRVAPTLSGYALRSHAHDA